MLRPQTKFEGPQSREFLILGQSPPHSREKGKGKLLTRTANIQRLNRSEFGPVFLRTVTSRDVLIGLRSCVGSPKACGPSVLSVIVGFSPS